MRREGEENKLKQGKEKVETQRREAEGKEIRKESKTRGVAEEKIKRNKEIRQQFEMKKKWDKRNEERERQKRNSGGKEKGNKI